LLWGLPLAILALTPVAAIAYLALVVVGIGKAVVDVSGFTLVTRLAGPGTAGKALGALEFVALAGLATGSIVTPAPLHSCGVCGTLVLLGGGLAGLALAHAVRFRRLDRAMPEPGPAAGLLRDIPRTTTVTAQQPLSTLTIGRLEFLIADTGPTRQTRQRDVTAVLVRGAVIFNALMPERFNKPSPLVH
jgi:hypothetical protein